MDTKLRILKEAGIMFSRYGIRSITMEYIASQLGISKRTLYEKFKDKDELILESIREGVKAHRRICHELVKNSEHVVDAMFKIAKLNNEVFQKITPLFFEDLKKYHPEINEKMICKDKIRDNELSLSLLRRGIDESIIRDDINVEVVNVFMYKVMDILHSEEFERISKEDVRNSVFLPYLYGISTEKGVKLIKETFKSK